MDAGRNVSSAVRGQVRGRGVRAARVPEKGASNAAGGVGTGAAKVRRHAAAPKVEKFVSVWDAIADTPGQAANLSARAELMRAIARLVERARWTQVEAAARAAISQPRMNDLLRGRISNFSLDALVGIADALGRRVSVRLMRAPRAAK